MSSELHEDIPPRRRLAILRKKQAEEAAAEAARKKNLEKNDATATATTDDQSNMSNVMAGGRGAGNALYGGDRAEENPVLNMCIRRIGKLETQMEELAKTNKKLEDLLSKVADRVGVSQDQ